MTRVRTPEQRARDSAAQKRRYHENPERHRAIRREYHQRHREEINARARQTNIQQRTKAQIQRDIERQAKVCNQCHELKPFSEFHRNKIIRDGYHTRCKPCALADVKARRLRFQATAPAEWRRTRREVTVRYKYGLSAEEYWRMVEEQEMCCAICGVALVDGGPVATNRLCVDHDHESGDVRGLLCDMCNNGIGRFRDDPAILIAAAKYLMDHKGEGQ